MSTSPEALARGISLAYRANPSLTPGLAYGAGSTDNPIDTGADFQRVLWAVNSRDKLGQMDEGHQKTAWHGLTADEQQLLQQVGYRAPRELHGVGGFFEGAGLGLYHATLGPVLNALQKGVRASQHIARVGQYLQENQPAGSDPFSRAGSLVTHWGEAWRKTMVGDSLIHDPQDEQTTLDAGARQIALEYAANNLSDHRDQQVAQSNLLAKYGATANQLLGDEEFQRYVDALQLRKLSPGRWVASALGVKAGNVILPEWSIGRLQLFPGVRTIAGQDLAHLLSGEYDALYDIRTDPSLLAGSVLKTARAAREATFLMQNYKDFQAVAENPSFRRAVNGIFDIFDKHPDQSVGRILDAYPGLNSKDVEALVKLHKAGELSSPERIVEFYGDKAKSLGIVTGEGQGAFDTSHFFNASTPAETAAATTTTATETAKTGLKVNRPFMLPHSSPLAPIRIAAKTTGETLIESMRSAGSDSGTIVKDALAPVRQAGSFLRKAVTLVPKDQYFNPNSTHALDTFRQIGLFGLSRDEVYKHLQVYAASDLGGKWAQYRSMLSDTFDALGASPLGTGADLHAYKLDFVGGLEGRILKGSYGEDIAGNTLSQLANDAGESFHAALTPAQVNKEAWALPNYAKLADLSSMVHKLRLLAPSTFGKLPEGWIHRAMTEVWKPLVLLRLGFPIRVAGEEAARAMLEEGFVPFVRGGLAFSGLKNEALATPLRNDSWLMADHKAYVAHLQDLAVEYGGKSGSITEPGRLATWWLPWRDHLAERTLSAMANTKFALAGERYAQAADVAIRLHGINIIDPEVAAGGRSAWLDTKPNLLKTIREDGVKTTRKVVVKPGWRGYKDTDELQNIAWQQRLAERHADGGLHAVWLDNHKDPAAARQAVYEWLHSEEAQPFLVASARGNHAASLESAQREVFMHDWADKIDSGYRGLYYTPADEAGISKPILNGKLIRLAKNGEVPTTELLSKIPVGQRPITVSGQRFVELNSRGLIQGVVNFGFERYIDPMITSISRGPLYIHELAKSLDKYEAFRGTLLAAGMKADVADAHIAELANHDAIGNIIPNVHDPLLRSQLQQSHRAMMPFLFAQEQFYKRWGRALLRDPAIWRKAQLTMHGLRSAGIIHQDANGEDVFVYPAVGFTQGVLAKTVKLITGKDIQIPVPAGLIGKVKQLNPATEHLGLPSFGPLMSVPLSAFGKTSRGQNQAYQAATRAIVGDYSMDRPVWEQIAPTVVARLFKAMNADPNRDAEFMSAQMAAITHLEAAGQGLPDDATPQEAEKFRERVQAWSRSFLYLRAIYGYAAPSAITEDIGGKLNDLTQEYRDLLAVSDSIEAANVAFIQRHPDHQVENLFAEHVLGRKEKIVGSTNTSALELSRSKLAGKGPSLTPSETVGQYLADNAGFVSKYGPASLWFAPDAPDGFDPRVYSQEIATGLRIRKAPGDFWKEAKIRHAAEMYYPNQRRYEAAAANLSGDALRELQNRWHDWKDSFLATHPFFAENLAQGQARATERQQGIYTLASALADKSAPKTSSRDALQSVVDAYFGYHAAYDALRGQRDKQSVAQRAGLLAAMQAFGDNLTDFRAKQAFESLIAPDLGG